MVWQSPLHLDAQFIFMEFNWQKTKISSGPSSVTYCVTMGIWIGFEEEEGHYRQRNGLHKDIKEGMSMRYSVSKEETSQTRERL